MGTGRVARLSDGGVNGDSQISLQVLDEQEWGKFFAGWGKKDERSRGRRRKEEDLPEAQMAL